jgi:translation elongation factor EF-4
MSLCIEKRGLITNQTYLTTERGVNFDMPLAEIVFDFTIVWKRFLKDMHRLIRQ